MVNIEQISVSAFGTFTDFPARMGFLMLPFERWKLSLQSDAAKTERTNCLAYLSDTALVLFWSKGVSPTCNAIIRDVERGSMTYYSRERKTA